MSPRQETSGQPLQLLWSREQDMRADRYRPQSAIRLKGALTPDGKLEALFIQSACSSIQRSTGNPVKNGLDATSLEGIGPSVPYNKVPNWYTGQMLKNTHVPVGCGARVPERLAKFLLSGKLH